MTSPRWTWLAGAVLLVALSYWMGKRHGAPDDARAPAATSAVTSARPASAIARAGAANASRALDGEELRAVVREELARSAAEREGAEPDPAAEPADAANPARGERMAQAVTAATAAIETGIVDGIWDERDREALRAQLPYLGERETHAVLSPLFQAVNAQRVKLDGPPI